jgi:DNA-binding response OmpR family regulator
MRAQPRLTILIVDDEKAIRELLKLHLANEGYDVLVAEDAVMGGRMFLEHAPELLIVDIDMPYLSGTEFVAALNADRTLPQPPVIFITGHEEHFHDALALGKACLRKPFYVDALLTRVRELLTDCGKRVVNNEAHIATQLPA